MSAILHSTEGATGAVWAIYFADERDFCLAASPLIGATYVVGKDAVDRLNSSAYGYRRFGAVSASSPLPPAPNQGEAS